MFLQLDENNFINGYAISGGFQESKKTKVVEVSNDLKISLVDFEMGKYTYIDGEIQEIESFETEKQKRIESLSIQKRIQEIKKQLNDTDYVVLKIAEKVATNEEYSDTLANRQAWREEINELEGKILV